MSAKMKSKYPNYTPNPRGCLAFVLDAYNCELKYGDKKPTPETDPLEPQPQLGGGVEGAPMTVEVTSGEETVPLRRVFNEKVEKDFIRKLENQFSARARRSTIKAATLEFSLIFRNNGTIKRVTRRKVGGGKEDFAGNLERTVKDFFNDRRIATAARKADPEKKTKAITANRRIQKFLDKKGRRMSLEVVIPPNYQLTVGD
jgi:hypothetical protein